MTQHRFIGLDRRLPPCALVAPDWSLPGSAASVMGPRATQTRGTRDGAIDQLMKPGALPDLVIGKADAPVTIVEYASLTCGPAPPSTPGSIRPSRSASSIPARCVSSCASSRATRWTPPAGCWRAAPARTSAEKAYAMASDPVLAPGAVGVRAHRPGAGAVQDRPAGRLHTGDVRQVPDRRQADGRRRGCPRSARRRRSPSTPRRPSSSTASASTAAPTRSRASPRRSRRHCRRADPMTQTSRRHVLAGCWPAVALAPALVRPRTRADLGRDAGTARSRHRQGRRAGHHRGVRLADLQALRRLPHRRAAASEDDLPRHRQGEARLSRLPARRSRRRRRRCWPAAAATSARRCSACSMGRNASGWPKARTRCRNSIASAAAWPRPAIRWRSASPTTLIFNAMVADRERFDKAVDDRGHADVRHQRQEVRRPLDAAGFDAALKPLVK